MLDASKLDPESIRQLQDIELRNSIEQLGKRVKALELEIVKLAGILTRLNVLETSRLNQIQLNSTFAVKTVKIPEKKSFLDFFKR